MNNVSCLYMKGAYVQMRSEKILGEHLYEVFCNSLNFKAIYNTTDDTIVDTNPSMKNHTDSLLKGDVIVVCSTASQKFIRLDGIPCKLTLLSSLEDGHELVDVSIAHTKNWSQASDLVSLTDSTSDGVWEWFPELDFEYMSERFWNILGYDQKDMEEDPKSWMGLLNPDDKVVVMEMFQEHIDSRGEVPYISKARYTRSDGNEVIVLCRGSIVEWMPDDRPWRVLGTHTDITDLVKKDAVEAKTKFIERMSHEIRSPVCTILNECELLSYTGKTKVITDTCKQLIALTDNVLSIDTSGGNEMELERTCESLADVLSKTAKRHRLQATKKGIKIRTVVDEVPDTVLMDLVKFNQVLDNLIGNAVKYSEGGVVLLDVEYDEDDSTCSVRVSDDGRGMDPSFHTRAFEELVQGDDTMLGAGIGLTLCRMLARLMRGEVTIEESSLGNGTTMLFESHLPAGGIDAGASDTGTSESPDGQEKGFRILVVDDIATNRVILKRRLSNMEGMGLRVTEVVEAADGRQAVDMFYEHGGDFQLVLMDCHMPIMDGFDATVKIHDACSSMGIEAVPVVAVTASVSSEIKTKCLSSGMKYVVTKPYSEMDLLTSIQPCSQRL